MLRVICEHGEVKDLRHLTGQFIRAGRVEAIFLRPARGAPIESVSSVVAVAGRGLLGDRSAATSSARAGGHKRQVTLLQAEHVPLIAHWLGFEALDAARFRRNLLISGWNLLSARPLFADQPIRVRIGETVELEFTGPCDPCSKMEAEFGAGAYNAMRGHGGLTSRVIIGGTIQVGDQIRATAAGSS